MQHLCHLFTNIIVSVSAGRKDCIGQLKKDTEVLHLEINLQNLETAPSENA